jgi:uncharacterized protein YjbI with pentapeptide repeats
MLPLANSAADQTKRVELKVDALKTAFTVGAGAAGGLALLLGLRRQWLNERTQAHIEYDSMERRVTELYTAATEQLGHDKSAVRLAGMYALERVGQNNEAHRQTVVDVLCAYLRIIPDIQGESKPFLDATSHEPSNDELQVRLAAQKILEKHLHRPRYPNSNSESFWPHIDVDLSGAYLVDFSLRDCQVRKAEFDGAHFMGDTVLLRAIFEGHPWGLTGPYGVGGASFADVCFEGDVNMEDACFHGDSSFSDCHFGGEAYICGVRFEGPVDFLGSTFNELATFEGTTFNRNAFFGEVKFLGPAFFSAGYIYETAARFNDEADFSQCRFHEIVNFKDAIFTSKPNVGQTELNNLDMSGALIRAGHVSDCLLPKGYIASIDSNQDGYCEIKRA